MEYPSHIHTPRDGWGKRKVFVNGKQAHYCFFADTKRGIARCFRFPFVLHKHGKRCLSKTLHGVVTVEADHGD